MNRYQHRIGLLFFMLICSFLTGCWDAKDIELRSFVSGVAFDLSDNDKDHVMTIEVPILGGFKSDSNGVSGSGETSVISSTTGTTVSQMSTQFESRRWRELFYGHTHVIIFGEDLARETGISPFIDFFNRNPRIDRRLKLYVAQGDAREVFKIDTPQEPLISNYLNRMLEVVTPTLRIVKQNFQDSLRNLENNGDTILPRVRPSDNEVVIAGSALIKDYKLIAWLGENETRAVAFLYDKIGGGIITANVDDVIYSFAIRNSSTKIFPKLENGKVTFTIKLKVDGDIIEAYAPKQPGSPQIPISKIEAKIKEIITEQIQHLLAKFQGLKTDPIGFNRYIYRHFPDFYEENVDRWKEEIFPAASFNIDANFKIRRIGIVR